MAHSDVKKAAALALYEANGGNVKATAAAVDVPYSTVAQWIAGDHLNDNVLKKRDEIKMSIANDLDLIAKQYAQSLVGNTELMNATHADRRMAVIEKAVQVARNLRDEPNPDAAAGGLNVTLANLQPLLDQLQARLGVTVGTGVESALEVDITPAPQSES